VKCVQSYSRYAVKGKEHLRDLRVDERITFQWKKGREYRLDVTGSEYEPVASSCELSNGTSCFYKKRYI
jgi:hypothetical protein